MARPAMEKKVDANAYEGDIVEEVAIGEKIENGNNEDSCPLILDTSAVFSENQSEIKDMGGGGKEGKLGSWFRHKMIWLEFRSEQKLNQAKADRLKADWSIPTKTELILAGS